MSGLVNAAFGQLCNCMWLPGRRDSSDSFTDDGFEAHGLLADDEDDA
eukprot:gene66-550_t